ncbi:HNH endonuclease signature motif containing protein [Fodinicurvata fenggangensis]|uniref:HNH endonuclease signature motif containing protein n=1 Tax=Fodinicurvata fenggangensis TaxID=1121830 RepID=UPI000478D4F5|nr:HNH endonuclease signature motif containing protein [Fodinicurvata fenggangensis]
MPMAPPKHCPKAGHPPYTQRRCPACSAAWRAKGEARRPSSSARGYGDPEWKAASKEFLARPENKLCACGCQRRANVVDHIVPHRGDERLFWDRSNWQPMAFSCNSRKAAKSEGGFGNRATVTGGGIC